MKIKLSKNQWELIGNKAGWIKEAASSPLDPMFNKEESEVECSYCGKTDKVGNMHELKRGEVWCCDKCLDDYPESGTKLSKNENN